MKHLTKKCSLLALSAVLTLGTPLAAQAILSPEIEEVFKTRTTGNQDIAPLFEAYKDYYGTLTTDGDETRLDKARLFVGGWSTFAELMGLKVEKGPGDIRIENGDVVVPDLKTRLSRTFFTRMETTYTQTINDLEKDIQIHRNAQQQFSQDDKVRAAHQERLDELLKQQGIAKEEKAYFAEKAKLGEAKSELFDYSHETGLLAMVSYLTHGYLYAKNQDPFVFAVLQKYEVEAEHFAKLLRDHDPRPKKAVFVEPAKGTVIGATPTPHSTPATGPQGATTIPAPLTLNPAAPAFTPGATDGDDVPPLLDSDGKLVTDTTAQAVVDRALDQGNAFTAQGKKKRQNRGEPGKK